MLVLAEDPTKFEFKFKLKIRRKKNLKEFFHFIPCYFSAFDHNLQVTGNIRKNQKSRWRKRKWEEKNEKRIRFGKVFKSLEMGHN